MTKRPPLSNINGVRILQAWVMSLTLLSAEAYSRSGPDRFCLNRRDGSFDFFYFVQQWPGSFCSRGCCFDGNLPASQFTIHGLWPTHIGGKSPCYCKPPSIPDQRKMTWELHQDMVTNWVSMTCPKPKPEGLWKHEWEKHGSCSGMDRLTYFETAIALHSTYNLLEALNLEGIYPNGRMYDLLDMHQVLESYIGEEPLITCSFNDLHQVYQIYEVYICLDKLDLLPFPCPNAASFNTKCWTPSALFPVFKPLGHPPSCPAHPHRHVRYCVDPGEVSPEDDGKLDFYLRRVDSEADEVQSFLGNQTDWWTGEGRLAFKLVMHSISVQQLLDSKFISSPPKTARTELT